LTDNPWTDAQTDNIWPPTAKSHSTTAQSYKNTHCSATDIL